MVIAARETALTVRRDATRRKTHRRYDLYVRALVNPRVVHIRVLMMKDPIEATTVVGNVMRSQKRMPLMVHIGALCLRAGLSCPCFRRCVSIVDYSAATCAPFCGTERFIIKTSTTSGIESAAKTRKVSK